MSPRWPAYVAALFSLEYAVGKAIMAARGELGVPFHPAPASVDLDGNIAVAQLGNAGLGVLSMLVALAFVQRWGRHVPRALLALGAGAALLSGLAGAIVVATSLTGLREDHGQWGIDSLVLGVAPLGAWLLLTIAAVREWRAGRSPRAAAPAVTAASLRPAGAATARLVALPRRAGAALSAAVRPGHRAAFAAAAACVAYGGLKLHWALGGEWLLRQTPLPADAMQGMLDRDAASVASHWGTVALALVGVALAAAIVRAPRAPRLLVIGVPGLLAVLMLARAGFGIVGDLTAENRTTPPAGTSRCGRRSSARGASLGG